jgi:glycosyltransferase involved in cell wall biosynthesis
MRIGIDARELTRKQAGGFHSYVGGLLRGLSAVDSVNEYVLFVDAPLPETQSCFPLNSCTRVISDNRFVAEWRMLGRAIAEEKLDVMHFPCNYGLKGLCVPTAITLHDCIGLGPVMAGAPLRARLLSTYSAWMIRRSVPLADAVITDSEYSRYCISQYFPGARERTKVIYLAGSLWQCATDQRALRDFGTLQTGEFILMLASVDPRKNIAMAIGAFAHTRALAGGCKIAVVCSHERAVQMVRRELDRAGLLRSADLLLGVVNTELQILYGRSLAFVFPSLDEGFGLPPLEAMACGCPVISSNRASMPEVLGEAALFFDPTSPAALASCIDAVWGQPSLAQRMRDAGRSRAVEFSWSRTAHATVEVYRSVALERGVRG